ncbi:conserved hypothetical protein [Talaromyces stipitatus ATCC 10500]|uniref:Cleavage/polyadenylation specificity factor A subunit N-terminal domain-containing protein n=1 Tax=Talaromyces stipitatus (strain ATCC 10500 / CBS 375.48 / QM 6759 / NRRL 1006) TaxID=441959 RepID=B8MFJ2_TALSN|nr:uncharacterized protein TSTA_018000 [Talaromyces stipitatus ATCC 10500]EED16726.1 conserved hypothetical protein [Talaromyces stipitatus ATCC 10500]
MAFQASNHGNPTALHPTGFHESVGSDAQRQQASDIMNPSKPRIGLLSQTIVPSPIIKFALPARLRSRRHNDVVFVYERSLLVREIIMDTYLEDVKVNSDFDANVVAAKTVNIDEDSGVKSEIKLDSEWGFLQENRQSDTLPGHILVLTLDSRELLFLYCHNTSPENDMRFVHFRRALPSDVSISERFGRHLAVDPRSRAVAVAAPTDFFGVFMLKPQEELRLQLKEGSLSPIAEVCSRVSFILPFFSHKTTQERFYRLEGHILFMDFLYPSEEQNDTIILQLIVARGPDTHAVSYIWDTKKGIRQARSKPVIHQLPDFCRLPNLLIPLTKSSSFLLVTPSFIVFVPNALGSKLKISKHRCYDLISNSPSIWAKWARPYRHSKYDKSHDDVFLCREDGRLTYVEIDNKGNLGTINVIGQLDCDVDAAFDTIDFNHPNHGGDLLIAAGNTGHGGLFIQIARQNPTCVQRFVNWAPVFDTVIVPPVQRDASNEVHIMENVNNDLKIYVCSASSSNSGAVYEFRHGNEAQIGMIISLEDFPAAQSIWVIPDMTQEGTYFLISDPMSSVLMHLSRNEGDDGEDIYAVDGSDLALDLSVHTLAAGHTLTGVLVQVTPNTVRSMLLNKSHLNCVSNFPLEQTAFVATVNEESGLVAVVLRSEQGITIQVGKVMLNDDSLNIDFTGTTVDVGYEPISITAETLKDATYVFVGTSDGRIAYYRIEQNEMVRVGEYMLVLPYEHISKAIESITLVDWVKTGKAVIYCGLRSGLLVALDVVFETMSINQCIETRFGQTAVRLLKKESSILVTCGMGFWCISDIRIGNASDFDLQRIWITDQNNSTYTQKSIEGFTIVNSSQSPSSNTLGGSLVCISDKQLLVCSLDSRAKAVPRMIELPGTVNRIEYSAHLKCLVVAYITTELEKDSAPDPDTSIVKRYMRPHLNFLTFDTSNSHLLSYQHNLESLGSSQSQKPVGSSGERITCILDWIPETGGHKYHFLVIGTARKTQEQKGRVVFLNAKRNPTNSEQIDCSLKYIHSFDGPVRAVAAYGDSTVMVAAGNDIIPIAPRLPNDGEQWAASARFKLTSPGVSITVRGSLLYVSTARESLVILQVVNKKLELYAQDGVRHESLSHQYMGGDHKLTLVSHRGGTISAFSESGVTDMDKIISPAVAEAHLPLSIIRLNAFGDPSLRSPSSSSSVVYGTTMDGAIYRISILTEKEWRLLRFIQNLCSMDPTISPLLSAQKRRWTWADIEPQVKKPSSMHVDGDILSRLLPKGTDYLRRMLHSDQEEAASVHSDAAAVIPLPRTYIEFFNNLSDDVFVDGIAERDRLDHLMTWLRGLLRHRF